MTRSVESKAAVSGTFGATGASAVFDSLGAINVSLSGFGTATVQLQRSHDGGSSWKLVKSYTANAEEVSSNIEAGVQWRLECTAYTSGTIAYRLSH